MSLFRAERRDASLDATMRAAGLTPRDMAGAIPVSPDSAMRLSVWWACVHLLASVVSGLPIDAFRKDSDGVRRELDTLPSVVANPSALVSQQVWRYQMMVSMLQRGNLVGVVTQRDRRFYAEQVELLHPDTVTIRQEHQLTLPTFNVGREQIPFEDVWHVPAFNAPGSVVGLSPLRYARDTIAAGLAADRFGAEWWEGGGHPTGVLSSDQALDDTMAKLVKNRFKDATRADKLAVLGAGLSYMAVQVSPEDAGWLDSINATDIMVCRFLGVPPEMVGIATSGSSVTYANREQRAIDFLTFSVQWWLTRIEEAWSSLLPRGVYVKHNADALLRTDTLTRATVAGTRLRSGITNVDFERSLEDLPPLPDGAGELYVWPPAGVHIMPNPEESIENGT